MTNLGVVLDRNLSMAYQVLLVNIIRDKLSVHVSERVVKIMATGNIYYFNSLLHGITAGQLGSWAAGKNTKTTKHSSQTHSKEKSS